MDSYDENTITLSDAVRTDTGKTWQVYLGSQVIGTIASPVFGTYTATVGGFEIGQTYDRITVAATAVKVVHDRAAAL